MLHYRNDSKSPYESVNGIEQFMRTIGYTEVSAIEKSSKLHGNNRRKKIAESSSYQ